MVLMIVIVMVAAKDLEQGIEDQIHVDILEKEKNAVMSTVTEKDLDPGMEEEINVDVIDKD